MIQRFQPPSPSRNSQAWASRYLPIMVNQRAGHRQLDGIHLGHKRFRATVERAQALNAVSNALTLIPSRAKVLRPETPRCALHQCQRMDGSGARLEAVVVLLLPRSRASFSGSVCRTNSLARFAHQSSLVGRKISNRGISSAGDVEAAVTAGAKHDSPSESSRRGLYRGEMSQHHHRGKAPKGTFSPAGRLLGRLCPNWRDVVSGTGTG